MTEDSLDYAPKILQDPLPDLDHMREAQTILACSAQFFLAAEPVGTLDLKIRSFASVPMLLWSAQAVLREVARRGEEPSPGSKMALDQALDGISALLKGMGQQMKGCTELVEDLVALSTDCG